MNFDEFKKKITEKSQNLHVTIEDKESKNAIKYSIHNDTTLWRSQSLFTKEPITINWIRSFDKSSIFYDIGANVGMYSIFCASINKNKVYSFEPESNNFQVLMENILLNNLSKNIKPFPIGISNETELTSLYLSSHEKGGSHHMLKESLNHNLEKKKSNLEQGIFSTTINDLIKKWNLPIPNYLKIDVDGIEYKIIEKSDIVLKNKSLKSILIEINSNRKEDLEIVKRLESYNFIYDKSQVDLAIRKSGNHIGYAEYLFYRK